ncbi:carnitine 3-dehydrogenase [Pontivivens insulae]|uniref:L-carnitine dehydrogenase n=1 Tax=Pontivivens insulae TaxID=1639689 RepID=A0A2R8A9R8_9RHOB|nr:carnitine 3-dehydrogenase [Pontivivens insulae]RED12729.1 carnitine 3-dehydrogenase [Pontivivens insulae]SPF28820.1 L-carnitine dehydrogenase [Pontivivens insulae]
MRAAIVGGGVIGGGWAARFLLNGWDVAVFDPDPEAERKIGEVLANARRSLPSLYDRALPAEGQLTFHADLADAVSGADWVQESVPERLDLKHKVHAAISENAGGAIVGSSTSGFKPSELNSEGANVIVAHPFNPVYLLPLIELVGDAATISRASDILRGVGLFPLHVRKEIDAHIADRFLEAVWREALWLVSDGIATTEEVDEAIRMGFGLRWAQMGLFETYRVAGGEAGMKHFMAQFGPALEWPWTKLMDVPEFTPELVDLIAGQSDAQSGDRTIRELERERDDNLVGILRALRKNGKAAGAVIAAHEAGLPEPEPGDLPITVERSIPQSWTDYNGHMNETHYLEVGAQASDRFMELIGADADYIAGGLSYFTVETHIRHLGELDAGDAVSVTTQVTGAEGKKLHLFHSIHGPNGIAATVETLLLHMDLEARRSVAPDGAVANHIENYWQAHRDMPRPQGAGRFVGER